MTNVVQALLIKLHLASFLHTDSGFSVVFKRSNQLLFVLHIIVPAVVSDEAMLCHAKSTAAGHFPPHHVLLLSTP